MAFVELMCQVGHHISDKAVHGCDVTQGSILGQMLFLLYMSMISTDARTNLGFTSLQRTLTFFMPTNLELRDLLKTDIKGSR